MSPSLNPDDAHAAVGVPPYVWEYVGWAVKAVLVFCFGWIIALYNDVKGLKKWQCGINAAAEFRDQQRAEILGIVKEVRDDVKHIRENHGERIAHLEGRNEGEDL